MRRTRRHYHQYTRTKIRHWRQKAHLTLMELAEQIGTSHATLSRLERGVHPYSQELLSQVEKEVNTPLS